MDIEIPVATAGEIDDRRGELAAPLADAIEGGASRAAATRRAAASPGEVFQ